jgi:hypothetical protein
LTLPSSSLHERALPICHAAHLKRQSSESASIQPMTHRTASCSCGQLQAHVTADPIRVAVCHCLACQRRTGSVFGAQARFASTAVTVQGTSKEFVRVGDEGGQSTFRFCPECGSTVCYTGEGLDGFVAIPVGAFADPMFPGPVFSVYEDRMHHWVSMPADIEHMA